MSTTLNEHIVSSYEDELTNLAKLIFEMGGMVEVAVSNATRALLKEREAEALAALRSDLGKPTLEGYASEIGFCVAEIDHTLEHLADWVAPEKVGTAQANFPASRAIRRDPLGVVLVIGPWNYPLQLVLAPLVGAIAAGNCVVVKPSEVAQATAAPVTPWLAALAMSSSSLLVMGNSFRLRSRR